MQAVPKPPPLRASQWADRHFYLSPESSGVEGPWKTLPLQRAILDLMGFDGIRILTVVKPSRAGYTKCLVAAMAYLVTYRRRSGALYQPTDSDSTEFKKDEINPALRDVDPLRAAMLSDPEVKSKHNTEDRVAFQAANLYIRGGKSGRNYRRLTLDWVGYDELSAFDADIDGEGSATALGDVRVTASAFPKSIRGSSPKIKGDDQIERSLAQAEVVLYRHLPCPECGELHRLEWKNFHFDKDDPEGTAAFGCPECGALYGYDQFSAMDRAGVWMSTDGRHVDEAALALRRGDEVLPWPDHVGIRFWAGYSYIQSWGRLARLWIEANGELKRTGDNTLLKTFINTQLAETWSEAGKRVDADTLQARRETYPAEVPMGALVLTMGVDVQADRLELEVVGHGLHREQWGVAYKVLHGDPEQDDVWDQLDAEIERTYTHEGGSRMTVNAVGVDTGGHHTKRVYEFCRTRHARRVYALKGQGGEGVPITRAPTKQKIRGARTVKLYSVGVDALKARLMASLERTPGQHGYQHFPDHYSDEWFEQLTSEVFVERFERGRKRREWKKLRARNEALDVRNYADAAFEIFNPRLDLAQRVTRPEPEQIEQKPSPRRPSPRRRSNFVTRR